MSNVNVESTQLDFEQIKDALKLHFAASSQFADYSFEASGLSNILDVLAYNTHYNALTANFALNEAFLNTAQLRSSVVSHAVSLGYSPRSRTASRGIVQLSLDLSSVSGRPATITLPAFTSFTSPIGNVSYTFNTIEAYTATDNGSGLYQFLNGDGGTDITIYEGTAVTKNFYVGEVGERQLYVIPDDTMDTATAAVRSFLSVNSTQFVSYTPIDKAIQVTSDSRYYQISEAPNGYYELNFGDGISFGAAPKAGEKITVQYLSTLGEEANGASSFTPTSEVAVQITLDGPTSNHVLNTVTVASSNSGAARQTIESIRQNAPISFAAQQRLVTAEDYKAVIGRNYPAVTDVTAWGGEDNDPPDYGKVYLSLVFQNGMTDDQKTAVKNSIVQDITNFLSIISVDTEFADPTTTFLELITTFNFDPSLTGVTIKATESNVFGEIQSYVNDNLKQFGGVFRRSELLARIDNVSDAILNSRIDVRIQQRFEPRVNFKESYNLFFPIEIAQPNQSSHTVTSSTFRFNNNVCSIKNLLNTTKLQIVNSDGEVEVDNIGQYDAEKGKVEITGFQPSAITAGVNYIKISATPANQSTIRPLRSYILDVDADISFASGNVDRQQTSVTLTAT